MTGQVSLDIGSEVWVPSTEEEVWQPAVVTDIDIRRGIVGTRPEAKDGRMGKVEVPHPAHNPGRPQVYLRNEFLKKKREALTFDDLGKLPILHEPAVLHALHVRFDEGIVYTNTGSILMAVNPFRPVEGLYDEAKLLEFCDLVEGEEARQPHVFGIARAAYIGMIQQQIPQTVLISGESGAGKTMSTKLVTQFLAKAGARASGGAMSEVQNQILQSIPLLEAVGNAKTKRNDNSSRFGKYIDLHFAQSLALEDSAPHVVGGKMTDYLLEKIRVTDIQEGERSYHIFYQALAAAARKQREGKVADGAVLDFDGVKLQDVAGKKAADFCYLQKSSETKLKDLTTGEFEDEAENFSNMLAAFRALEVTETDISDVLNTLVAVLYLGNVKFVKHKSNPEGSMVEDLNPLGVASRLLAVDPDGLEKAFCFKTRQFDGRAVASPVTPDKAFDCRNALARHLYAAVFAFVVERVNVAIQSNTTKFRGSGFKDLPAVGVLDIFGFEVFERNSFEQLCINYTNEKLQQYFNTKIWAEDAKLYLKEGIPVIKDLPLNDDIVKVIGEKPNGILPLLHSETIGWRQGPVSKADERKKETEWIEKLDREHGKALHVKPNGEQRKLFRRNVKRPGNFIIEHFAGEVEYTSEAFVEKNRDELSEKLVQCMQSSSSSFIKERSTSFDRQHGVQESVSIGTSRKTISKAKQYSVASEFQAQLEGLMERIRSTTPHFVRCIKPNKEKIPDVFDRRSVVEQLQYQGVVQAIEVSRAGYPMRLPHRRGVLEYMWLTSRSVRNHLYSQIEQKSDALAARDLFANLLDSGLPGLTEDNWAVGVTQIFLKPTGVEALSVALSRKRHAAANRLQATGRRHIQRKHTAVTRVQAQYRCHADRFRFKRQRSAVVRMQGAVRVLLAVRLLAALRQDRAAVLIQRCERGRVGRCRCRKVLEARNRLAAATVLQANFRAIYQQRRYAQTLLLIVKLQRWLRQRKARMEARRWRRHGPTLAIGTQRLWRGHCGRREVRKKKAIYARFQHLCTQSHRRRHRVACDWVLELRNIPTAKAVPMPASDRNIPVAKAAPSQAPELLPSPTSPSDFSLNARRTSGGTQRRSTREWKEELDEYIVRQPAVAAPIATAATRSTSEWQPRVWIVPVRRRLRRSASAGATPRSRARAARSTEWKNQLDEDLERNSGPCAAARPNAAAAAPVAGRRGQSNERPPPPHRQPPCAVNALQFSPVKASGVQSPRRSAATVPTAAAAAPTAGATGSGSGWRSQWTKASGVSPSLLSAARAATAQAPRQSAANQHIPNSKVYLCPVGHELKEFRTDEDGYWCSRCHTKMPRDSALHGCRNCDFDACDNCLPFFTKERIGAAASHASTSGPSFPATDVSRREFETRIPWVALPERKEEDQRRPRFLRCVPDPQRSSPSPFSRCFCITNVSNMDHHDELVGA